MAIVNLGLVKAIFVSSTAPSNQNVIWKDTVNGIFKEYDTTSSTWRAITREKVLVTTIDSLELTASGIYIYKGTTNAIFELPLLTNHLGEVFRFKNRSSNGSTLQIIVNSGSGDKIYDSGERTSITLLANDKIESLFAEEYWTK